MTIAVKLPDSASRGALRDFYEDYAAALDDMRLEDWTGFFTADAVYKVMARETFEQGLSHATIYCEGGAMIRDRAASVRHTAVYEPRRLRHFISGVRVISATDKQVQAEANFLIGESMFDRASRVFLVGQYRDRIVITADGPRFRERIAIYDNHAIPTTLIIPV